MAKPETLTGGMEMLKNYLSKDQKDKDVSFIFLTRILYLHDGIHLKPKFDLYLKCLILIISRFSIVSKARNVPVTLKYNFVENPQMKIVCFQDQKHKIQTKHSWIC